MNTYEFWNDMDKIFEAIASYQEKTIEFNKKFITPWVHLGNVFDKKENNEAVIAHKNAVEIDPGNPQNWYELANVYTRVGAFDNAIQAFQKAVSLGFESGELYKNLGLAHAMTGKYQEAVPFFEKSIELFEQYEEKSIVWNHLGNVYRKLDNYEIALQAFQQADQLEMQRATTVENPMEDGSASQLTDELVSVKGGETLPDDVSNELTEEVTDVDEDFGQLEEEQDEAVIEAGEEDNDDIDDGDDEMPVILEFNYSNAGQDALAEEEFSEEQTTSEFLKFLEKESIETLGTQNEDTVEPDEQEETEMLPDETKDLETIEVTEAVSMEDFEEGAPEVIPTEETIFGKSAEVTESLEEVVEDDAIEENSDEKVVEEESFETDKTDAFEIEPDHMETVSIEEKPVDEVPENTVSEELEGETDTIYQDSETVPVLSAYEEYLRDQSEKEIANTIDDEVEKSQTIAMSPEEIEVTQSEFNMDTNEDMTFDSDTKNAHVWNELGNVYFNAGSFEDAIAAFNRAIELDKQFPWPYTNLALTYVQQDRLDEAIMLYQRSIELFANDKDKAMTWNRLGNAYRRLNEYEKAIAAYQRADQIDPGNSATARQSHLSLLGSEKIDQEVNYSV